MFGGFPMAMLNVSNVERISEDKLVKTAKELGFDLSKYED